MCFERTLKICSGVRFGVHLILVGMVGACITKRAAVIANFYYEERSLYNEGVKTNKYFLVIILHKNNMILTQANQFIE